MPINSTYRQRRRNHKSIIISLNLFFGLLRVLRIDFCCFLFLLAWIYYGLAIYRLHVVRWFVQNLAFYDIPSRLRQERKWRRRAGWEEEIFGNYWDINADRLATFASWWHLMVRAKDYSWIRLGWKVGLEELRLNWIKWHKNWHLI